MVSRGPGGPLGAVPGTAVGSAGVWYRKTGEMDRCHVLGLSHWGLGLMGHRRLALSVGECLGRSG